MVRALASFTLGDVESPSLGEARMSERWRALNEEPSKSANPVPTNEHRSPIARA